jgi:uncharacterized protein (DUF2235 family)
VRNRLIVCCDGTWMASDSRYGSNVERISRWIVTQPADGSLQLVLYLPGVGAQGYRTGALVGGAFGSGLEANLVEAYRFLALNYEPGDAIYLFGFSRGAYTARSLAGMISKLGLMKRRELDGARLRAALVKYRNEAEDVDEGLVPFDPEWCHQGVEIEFVGVFDTVGSLGVPGRYFQEKYRFHSVNLGGSIRHARQALAIDERRRRFEPCLWGTPAPNEHRRVKQVWFEGAHSDVGGGYAETGLSDEVLLWMMSEACATGLHFDRPLVARHWQRPRPRIRHDSLSGVYKFLNVESMFDRGENPRFRDGQRTLESSDDAGVAIASTARSCWEDEPPYHTWALNIGWWRESLDEPDLREESIPTVEEFLDG